MRVPVQVQAVLDAAKEPLASQAEATAAWIVLNALRTVAVYTTSIDEANAFRSLLRDAIKAEVEKAGVADPQVWSKVVNSQLLSDMNRLVLDTFMRATPTARLEEPWTDRDGNTCNAQYCILILGGKPREDFPALHFPALQAAVMLDQSGTSCAPVDIVDHVSLDASFKPLGRVLVFSTDEYACKLWARAVQEHHDPKEQMLSFGCVPRAFDDYAAMWDKESRVHARLRAASKEFQERIVEQLKAHAWAGITTYRDACRDEMIDGFINAFPMSAPRNEPNDNFSIRVCGLDIVFNGHVVYNELRRKWFVAGQRFSTTELEKEHIRKKLGPTYWKDPEEAAPEEQMNAQIYAFLDLFPDTLPGRSTSTTMIYKCKGIDYGPIEVWPWFYHLRRNWRAEARPRRLGDMFTTEAQKATLRRHPRWKDPVSKRRRDEPAASGGAPSSRGAPTEQPSCGIENSDIEN